MRRVDAIARGLPSQPTFLRTGVVLAVTGSTVTLDLAGASLPGVPRLVSYASPAAGDVVQVLQAGPQLLVLGPPAT